MARGMLKFYTANQIKISKKITMETFIFWVTRLVLLACLAVLVYMMMPNYADQSDGWE
ncbi:hypothetical protein SAMN05192573_1234 [Mucilaginibacter gossypii]|uniref:Uncharacterized protein n=1 Tax=Mucilaginibacter gossypii TaxID=551996 RepID=A0A1G8LD45_9SPHI|nr:hypothetical protein SAMN05192573_1234 [Mucilaginibacter gossypii]